MLPQHGFEESGHEILSVIVFSETSVVARIQMGFGGLENAGSINMGSK